VYHGNVRSLNRRDFEFGSSFNAQSPDLEERVPRLHPAEMNFVTRELCVRGIPFVEFLIKNGTSDTAVRDHSAAIRSSERRRGGGEEEVSRGIKISFLRDPFSGIDVIVIQR